MLNSFESETKQENKDLNLNHDDLDLFKISGDINDNENITYQVQNVNQN